MVRSIQYLRAIAALMVVCVHCSEQLKRLGDHELPLADVLPAGVDIFFVISGFVIWYATDRKNSRPLEFFLMRIARIGPPYWFVTLLLSAVALFAPFLLSSTKFDAPHIAASLLFVPWPHPKLDRYWPMLIPGWTLNYEMMFYLLFAFALVLSRTRRLVAIVSILAGLALLGATAKPSGVLGVYTHSIILEFGFGVLLGAAFTSGVRVGKLNSIVLLGLGIGLLVLLSPFGLPRSVAAGIPALLICCGSVFLDEDIPKSKTALFLGDASYSIYLTHVLALPFVTKAWLVSGMGAGGLSTLIFVAAGLGAAIFVGCITYWFIERPLVDAAKSLLLFRRTSASLPGQN